MKKFNEKRYAIFCFAHQDDECGVFEVIKRSLDDRIEVLCIYFTSGKQEKCTLQVRNNESLNVLTKLGVKKSNIFFAGDTINICDGYLYKKTYEAFEWFNSFLEKYHNISNIYVPAWEGGHHDHDLLHAIVLLSSHNNFLDNTVMQFPLYNSLNCPRYFFKVMSPLPQNGKILKLKIKIYNRFIYLKYCLSYPSQIKTWIALFPFFFIKYIFGGYQLLQYCNLARLNQRPCVNLLFYESRWGFTWQEMRKLVLELKKKSRLKINSY